MASKARYPGPAEALTAYERLISGNPHVERKGAAMPYTSRNGNMFSFLDAEGTMALRLPAELRDMFLTGYETHIVEQHGRELKEYVAVPDALLKNPDELGTWFDLSHDWAGTIKPKSTKRR